MAEVEYPFPDDAPLDEMPLDGMPFDVTAHGEPPFDGVEVVVADDDSSVLGDIVDAIHEAVSSPEEIAAEHLHEAEALQAGVAEALSVGDLDTAATLHAEAGEELQAALDAMHPPADVDHDFDAD